MAGHITQATMERLNHYRISSANFSEADAVLLLDFLDFDGDQKVIRNEVIRNDDELRKTAYSYLFALLDLLNRRTFLEVIDEHLDTARRYISSCRFAFEGEWLNEFEGALNAQQGNSRKARSKIEGQRNDARESVAFLRSMERNYAEERAKAAAAAAASTLSLQRIDQARNRMNKRYRFPRQFVQPPPQDDEQHEHND
jgi:hypothetical protein